MDYTFRLAGSSLIPFDIIGKSLLGVLFLMMIVHLVVNFMRKDLPSKKRRKMANKIGGGILSIGLFLGLVFGAYWLLPPPHVLKTTPAVNSQNASLDKKIEIIFDRPVSRSQMTKTIKPDIPGVWVFEGATYSTHLTRKIVFYPFETLSPNTEYTITLSGITNALKLSDREDYEFVFKTHKLAEIEKVLPGNGERLEGGSEEVQVIFTDPIEGNQVEFEFFPTIAYETKIDKSRKVLSIIPKEKLEPSAHYQMKIFISEIKKDLYAGETLESGQLAEVYNGDFQTSGAVGAASVLPVGANVAIDDTVAIRFSEKMNQQSVEKYFSLDPPVKGVITWADQNLMVFNPERYQSNTRYTIRVRGDALKSNGEKLGEEVVGHFTTLGKVMVEKITPSNGDSGVGISSPIKVTLNQDVNRLTAQANFEITPEVRGKFSWRGRQMIFTPSIPLEKNTTYMIALKPGIGSVKGLSSDTGFVAAFTTTQTTFKLPVPAYLQQHPLSCEVSSLRMALAFRGISATEDDLIVRLGNDPTPHKGNIWGNPYKAYVGEVDGKQMTTGYGVYWGPIARVALGYTQAMEFTGWSTERLLNEVAKGSPVIIWGYSGSGRPVYWTTPEGEKIYAVGGEHTYVVVGFVGSPSNPSRIIVNDSLVGQLYMSKIAFEKKWNSFGRSGVVVY